MQSIPRRLSHCVLGREPLEPGSEYISFLDEEGNRKDYCPTCLQKIDRPQEQPFWKGVIPLKKKKISQPDQKAFELFTQTQEPKIRFILALYLLRKNQLVRRTETLYEFPLTGDVFIVEKVILSSQESISLAELIDTMIHGNLSD